MNLMRTQVFGMTLCASLLGGWALGDLLSNFSPSASERKNFMISSCENDLKKIRGEATSFLAQNPTDLVVQHTENPTRVPVSSVLQQNYAKGLVLSLTDDAITEICSCKKPSEAPYPSTTIIQEWKSFQTNKNDSLK